MVTEDSIMNARILVVDDFESNTELIVRMLREGGYGRVDSTTDPFQVCPRHRQERYDLILLDIEMPGMNGFQVMAGLREIEKTSQLPVIVITGLPEHSLDALRAGARDFITKPFHIEEVLARVHNTLEARLLQKELLRSNILLEERVRERTAELHGSYQEAIFTLVRAAEYRDVHSGAHVQRISHYCREVAARLGLGQDFQDAIFFASPMHDVGKLGIPDQILLKQGALTREEWEVMKEHAVLGAKILGGAGSPYLRMGEEIALNHHELYSGGGYPAGRTGESIPLAARIVTICDVYDSLRSKRPYKPAIDHAQAMEIIRWGDGRTRPDDFDPRIIEAFHQHHQAWDEIFHAYSGQNETQGG